MSAIRWNGNFLSRLKSITLSTTNFLTSEFDDTDSKKNFNSSIIFIFASTDGFCI
jgi:hypothetical protein